MKVKRGDVLLAIFPHAMGTGAKKRPVVVVQSDAYNQTIHNTLVAEITSNLTRATDPAHLLIDLSIRRASHRVAAKFNRLLHQLGHASRKPHRPGYWLAFPNIAPAHRAVSQGRNEPAVKTMPSREPDLYSGDWDTHLEESPSGRID